MSDTYWTAVFVMLNPSTADGERDDQTIRRCVGFAQRWGCDQLHVVNLYAWRATHPEQLRQVEDPTGPRNDAYLAKAAAMAAERRHPLVIAWGGNAPRERVEQVMTMPGFERARCLGMTATGAPRHPSRLPASTPLRRWPPPRVSFDESAVVAGGRERGVEEERSR